MTTDARAEYGRQLGARKAGHPSELDGSATFPEAKPHFYADARRMIDDVREAYTGFRQTLPPYGLMDMRGEVLTGFSDRNRAWTQLEQAMSRTVRHAFEIVEPPSCPYHESLGNLGAMALNAAQPQAPDQERLREITYPGGALAPATIVNMLKRMPAMAAANGATVSTEELARNSAHPLLYEPLHHPQQLAKAFTFSIADGVRGTDFALDRDSFMPGGVIRRYTKLGHDVLGREVIDWRIPTRAFVLRANVGVADRIAGSEADFSGDHITVWPIGTRIGDIEVTEPTVGCPGSQMAYDMWDQAVDVIVGEGLWA